MNGEADAIRKNLPRVTLCDLHRVTLGRPRGGNQHKKFRFLSRTRYNTHMQKPRKYESVPSGGFFSQKHKYFFTICIAVIAILVISNAVTGYLYVRKGATIAEGNGQYPLLNPARKFIEQKDLIINFQPLRDYLNDKYEADPNTSIYFEYLSTGANIAINKDAEFYPASLLKVPVAMAVAKKIEKGDWKWSNELVLMSSDKDEKFGTLYTKPTNLTFTIEELMRQSLSYSDNTAHFILTRNLEIPEIEDANNHIGFINTNGNLSAKRYSVIFRSLHNASYLSEENSQKLLLYLSQSPFKEYLESGLPSGVPFAHKIGTEEEKGIYLDSGIVYATNRPYILTVMIKSKNEQSTKDKMKDISEKVYNYVMNYRN